jgi:hypothetical protein
MYVDFCSLFILQTNINKYVHVHNLLAEVFLSKSWKECFWKEFGWEYFKTFSRTKTSVKQNIFSVCCYNGCLSKFLVFENIFPLTVNCSAMWGYFIKIIARKFDFRCKVFCINKQYFWQFIRKKKNIRNSCKHPNFCLCAKFKSPLQLSKITFLHIVVYIQD